jgi:hypothetical protein
VAITMQLQTAQRPGTRPVAWLRTNLRRDAVGPDLLSSLGADTTVCEIHRHCGADRFDALADVGSTRAGRDEPTTGATATRNMRLSAMKTSHSVRQWTRTKNWSTNCSKTPAAATSTRLSADFATSRQGHPPLNSNERQTDSSEVGVRVSGELHEAPAVAEPLHSPPFR